MDPATAADEFNQVRVLKQPLGLRRKRKPEIFQGPWVGIEVPAGTLGFLGLMFVAFEAH